MTTERRTPSRLSRDGGLHGAVQGTRKSTLLEPLGLALPHQGALEGDESRFELADEATHDITPCGTVWK